MTVRSLTVTVMTVTVTTMGNLRKMRRQMSKSNGSASGKRYYIALKTVPFADLMGQTGPLDFRRQLKAILQAKPQGFDYDGLLQALQVIDALNHADDYLEADEATYLYIKGRLREWPIPVADSAMLEFLRAINEAPTERPA
jgi:hypothetical protein